MRYGRRATAAVSEWTRINRDKIYQSAGPDWDEDDSPAAAARIVDRFASYFDAGERDEFVAQTARLLRSMREDQPGEAEALSLEEHPRFASRRALLLASVARYHAAGEDVARHFRRVSVPALVPVFRALGYGEAYHIVQGLEALRRGVARDEPAAPSSALLQALVTLPLHMWSEFTGEMPYPEDLEDDDSAVEFAYLVLEAAGWDCTREEVLENMDEAVSLLCDLEEVLEG